jgi:hypothetical protein
MDLDARNWNMQDQDAVRMNLQSAGVFAVGTVAHTLFHRAWTMNVGRPGYDKATWKMLERELILAAQTDLNRPLNE